MSHSDAKWDEQKGRHVLSGREIPPHNDAAELAVIGSMLTARTTSELAGALRQARLTSDDFYSARRGLVFQAAATLTSRSVCPDKVGVIAELDRMGVLDRECEQVVTIAQGEALSVEELPRLGEIITAKSRLRRVIGACAGIAWAAKTWGDDINTFIRQSRNRFNEAAVAMRGGTDAERLADLALAEISALLKRSQGEDVAKDFVPTGFREIDDAIGGYPVGEGAVIAARPSMGKTSLETASALRAALNGNRVHIFSLEDANRKLVQRVIAQLTRHSYKRIRGIDDRPKWNFNEDMKAITPASSHIANYQNHGGDIYFDRSRRRDVSHIVDQLYAGHAEFGTTLAFFDYVQIIRGGSGDNRNNQVGDVMGRIVEACADLHIAPVFLCQLNREVEKREGKRPQLSDLRDSGEIEQNARLVLMPYRPEFYKIDELEDGTPTKGKMFVDIAKASDGDVGATKTLNWYGSCVLPDDDAAVYNQDPEFD